MSAQDSLEHRLDSVFPFQAGRAERLSLIEQWKAGPQPRDQTSRHRRYDFENLVVNAKIIHPAGGESLVEILLVNLSAGGCCMIHRGYLHPTTQCMLDLPANNGSIIPRIGTARWCQMLCGPYHTSGLKWDIPIQPRDYVDPRLWVELSQTEIPQTTETLKGRFLLLTRDQMQDMLIQMLLRESNATLDTFDSSGSALDAVRSGGFDIVIVDTDNTEIDLESIPSRLSDEGYTGPVLALTHDTGPTMIETLRSSGYSETLIKPLRQELFIAGIHMAIELCANAASGTGPIESALDLTDDSHKWVTTYITLVRDKAKTLEEAARADDAEVVRTICDSIRDSGASYGFPLLTEVANAALTAVNASNSAKESMSAIRQLIRVIERLRAPSPPSRPSISPDEIAA